MREKPILFKPEMVRAILKGNKTQTRRILKIKNNDPFLNAPISINCYASFDDNDKAYYGFNSEENHYKAPFDPIVKNILWVRESYNSSKCADHHKPSELLNHGYPIFYENGDAFFPSAKVGGMSFMEPGKKRPSIFMCRWMSRITLKVTNVRVEKLQAISEDDAKCEGPPILPSYNYINCFRVLWDSINKDLGYSWESNPYVWVYEFERIER